MNVKNNSIIKYFFFSLFIFYFSCDRFNNLEEENTYQILSLLLNKFSDSKGFHPNFPPNPEGKEYIFSTKDSLQLYKYFYKKITDKKIIAISPKMFTIKDSLRFKNDCTINLNLIKNNKNIDKIDLAKISILKNDSLIYFLGNKKKEYPNQSNIYFNFSKIIFSNDYKKAVIALGISFGKLNGFTTLIYLEKNIYHWNIKCERELNIS